MIYSFAISLFVTLPAQNSPRRMKGRDKLDFMMPSGEICREVAVVLVVADAASRRVSILWCS